MYSGYEIMESILQLVLIESQKLNLEIIRWRGYCLL